MPIDLSDTSIDNILMERLSTMLEYRLKIIPDDDAKAGVVRAGKLQDDPTDGRINLLIHPGGIDFPDEIDTARFGKETVYEIGGDNGNPATVFWRRKFRIEITMFFSANSRINARNKAHVLKARMHNALLTDNIRNIPRDSFGESVWGFEVCKIYLNEGGGDDDFNWRGECWIEYFTQIDIR